MVPENETPDLADRREKFCNEYLVDLNGTQAAIRAGYAESGAGNEAWRLLKNADVQKRLAELREQMGKGFNITKERIAQELAKIAFFDIRKIHTIDGSLKPVTEFDDESAAAIAGIEVWEETLKSDDPGEQITVGKLKKIKISDKRAALDSLSRLMGYNEPDKHALTDKDGNPIPVQVIQLPHNGRGIIETKE